MKYVKFGKVNKKLLIPVLGGIILLIYVSTIRRIPKYDAASNNPFVVNLYVSLGMILVFIPYIILKHKTKESNNPIITLEHLITESKLSILLIHQKAPKSLNSKKYLLILCSEVFDFSQIVLTSFFSINCIYNFRNFDILLMSLLSCFILKIQLYRHQILSIIIIVICGIMMNILEYYKQVDVENKLDFFGISMTFLSELCFCISYVIVKYNMEKTFCSP